ncbi:diguanylate cyclase domain-containing protein [Roseateles sp. NT4]|uniref:diguanylate cyclase domain-containing protein n=1 Tax=Roseateles sp. NT4 TaxID=3453715 RepID=UPI003EEF1E2C
MATIPDTLDALRAELASLQSQAVNARAELARLRADLAQARTQLDGDTMHRLLAANEQLVVDAMRARDMADSTALLMAELSRSSELDSLTQLPNRLLLVDRFSQGLTHARRQGGRLALLFLDLDGFKQINDKLGHRVGDEVLRAVSLCLVSSVRQIDTVCRLGGDEFIVLLPEIMDAADPGLVAQKLMDSLASLMHAGGVPVRVSASIGISVYPDDAEDIEALVDCADQAMYRSKRAGGGCYSFFSTLGSGASAC